MLGSLTAHRCETPVVAVGLTVSRFFIAESRQRRDHMSRMVWLTAQADVQTSGITTRATRLASTGGSVGAVEAKIRATSKADDPVGTLHRRN